MCPSRNYLFFILQTLMTGTFLFFLARRFRDKRLQLSPDTRVRIRVFGALFWLLVGAAGVLALSVPKGDVFRAHRSVGGSGDCASVGFRRGFVGAALAAALACSGHTDALPLDRGPLGDWERDLVD